MAPATLHPRSAGRSLVIGHRGDPRRHPENTLASFAAAADAGADLVELDVRLTADGVPIVLHDPDLSRTTDRSGPVHERTLAEVREADASGGRGERQHVPTLAEVLDLLGETATGVDLEIKNLPGEAAYDTPREACLHATLDVLAGARFPNPVLVTSFNPATLRRCHDLAPALPTGLLTFASGDLDAAVRLSAEAGHALALVHAVPLLEEVERVVSAAHAQEVGVGVWTVDEEAAMRMFLSSGVDALITNDPSLGVAVRDGGAP